MVYNSRPGWLASFTLFPGRCLCCGASSNTSQDLCPDCKSTLPWQIHSCPRCALPLSTPGDSPCGECQRKLPAFQRAIAPFRYTTPINRLINDFKHHDRQAGGRVLGELFCEWLIPQLENQTLEKPDYLLPVPLHWSRLWKRGFNQAQWLAQDIGEATGIQVIHDGLQRKQAGLAQQALTRQQRQSNLHDVFQPHPKRLALLKERHIAIVDDVMTTGSTAGNLAGLLLSHGASQVSVWVIARTPKK